MKYLESFWGLKSDISFKKYYLFKGFNFGKVQAVLNQFRTPLKELGAQQLCDSVFPQFKGKIAKEEIPTHKDVNSFDAYEVNTYCTKKVVSKKNIDQSKLKDALKHVCSKFSSEIEYYSINDYDECINTLPSDTSSCYPRYMKKGLELNVKQTKEEMSYFDSKLNVNTKSLFLQQFPTTIFHRFTPKIKHNSYNDSYSVSYKIRQIFGVSHFICALEVKYFSYFINNFKHNMYKIMTIGLTRPEVSKLISNVRNEAIITNRVIMCGDIKGCDKSIPAHFHRIMFDMFIHLSPNKFIKNCINCIGDYLTYTPILRSDNISFSHGSTTSGSWITSIFNTFSIYVVICYCYLVLYNRLPLVNEVLVQGDDFICVVDDGDEDLIQEMFFFFNLRIKLDSTLISRGYDSIEFLGFKWDFKNTPFQEDSWIYVRTVYPEKSVAMSGPDRIISRYLSLIFQCNNGSALFKRFLKYDLILYEKFLTDPNPTFSLLDNSGKITLMSIPISYFLSFGWKAF